MQQGRSDEKHRNGLIFRQDAQGAVQPGIRSI
jgi:hypothetical protein